jgi:acetyl esterase/lipase
MKPSLYLAILLAACCGLPAQEGKFNDAFLLRQLKRYQKADLNKDGRLTSAEWLEFEAAMKLRKEMREEEERAVGSKEDTGKRVPPTHVEIAYGPYPEQRLNLWVVPSERPTPVIVHIHGGGFIQGGKQDVIDSGLHERLLAAGVSYASVQYRFQSKDFPLPEVLKGIARAVQFLRHGAEQWNLDPMRFAAYRSSAGAAASTYLGMRDDLAEPTHADPVLRQSSRLQAVWAISVAASMDVWEWPKYNPQFPERLIKPWIQRWGYDPETDPNDPDVLKWRQEVRFSSHASADDCSMVIVNEHFSDNVAHNPKVSLALYEIAKSAGINVQCFMREELDNMDEAPNPFDWMIQQLLK